MEPRFYIEKDSDLWIVFIDFNGNRFLRVDDFKSEEKALDFVERLRIAEIDKNYE